MKLSFKAGKHYVYIYIQEKKYINTQNSHWAYHIETNGRGYKELLRVLDFNGFTEIKSEKEL